MTSFLPVVAVDGPTAAGKGTLARGLARHFGFAYLDTGALYRAVAWRLIAQGADAAGIVDETQAITAARSVKTADLDRPGLRQEAVGILASKVAAMAGVRAALFDFQQDFARHPPRNARGAVLDGRDIGTVICPEAEAKLFVTARPEIRAARRHRELVARAEATGRPAEAEVPSEATILSDLISRDTRDRDRAAAPLRPAADAYLLDTSDLSIEGAFAAARDFVQSKL